MRGGVGPLTDRAGDSPWSDLPVSGRAKVPPRSVLPLNRVLYIPFSIFAYSSNIVISSLVRINCILHPRTQVHRTHAKDSHPKLAIERAPAPSGTRISSPRVIARAERPWRVQSNPVVCPRNGPGVSAHRTQSGGCPAHLPLLPSTGVKKPALKHFSQETWNFFF